ncbi:MAG: hypothetical protein EX269_08390 [Acidimicrobiales bacterium]|nr:MAG: hypothetical protein EX269_08390 [Acidimicrobiales bacterium]
MSHIVVYQGADGSAGYEPCDNLDAAIVAAERMRNVDGVDSPRIFSMEEVEFDFRPYYRVELPGTENTDVFEPAEAAEEPSALTGSVLTNEISDSWDAPSTDDVAEETTQVGEAEETDESAEETDESVVEEMTEQDAPAEESVEEAPAITFAEESVESDMDSTPVSDIFDAAPIEADSPPPPSDADASDEDEDAPSMISVRRGLFGR